MLKYNTCVLSITCTYINEVYDKDCTCIQKVTEVTENTQFIRYEKLIFNIINNMGFKSRNVKPVIFCCWNFVSVSLSTSSPVFAMRYSTNCSAVIYVTVLRVAISVFSRLSCVGVVCMSRSHCSCVGTRLLQLLRVIRQPFQP